MVYESVAQMIMGVSIFGGGMILGILALLFGTMRGMTKNSDVWAITFSAFAWAFALAIPNPFWSSGIFLAGAIGITLSFIPIIKELHQSNIFVIAIIAVLMNSILLVGLGAYNESLNWGDNFAESQAFILESLGEHEAAIAVATPGHGLCSPVSSGLPTEDSNTCSAEALEGTYNPLIFDPFASVLTIGKYIGKGIKFAGMAVLAPLVISNSLKSFANNALVIILIGLYANIWNLIVLYQAIRFILNKRGES